MSRQALAKIWGWLGLTAFVLAFNTWAIGQGGPAWHIVPFHDGRPVITCFYTLFAVAIILIVLSVVGSLYAANSSKAGWASRLPLFGIEDEQRDTEPWPVRVYAGLLLVLFVALPATSLQYFHYKVREEGVIWNASSKSSISVRVSESWPNPDKDAQAILAESQYADLRLANSAEDVKADQASTKPEWPMEISEGCRNAHNKCRGIDWSPFLSNNAMWLFKWAAWLAALFYTFGALFGLQRHKKAP